MGLGSTLIGGAMGFGTVIFSNSIKKVPLSRQPWMHALMFMVGCAAGNYYPKLEKELVEDVNELRAQRGLPPMVGTGAWIKYRPPEGEDMQISFQKK